MYSYGFMQGINAAAQEYGVTYDYYAKYDAGFTDPAPVSYTHLHKPADDIESLIVLSI